MSNTPDGVEEQPPTPGGDPDQPDDNLPKPPPRGEREVKNQEKTGYGHLGNREEVPLPAGAPKPHQIF